MIKIKFIQFYSGLNRKEKKEFRSFISSGYYNKGRDFSPILLEIEKSLPLAKSAAEMIGLLSRSLKYTSRSVWNRLHELKSLAERYIVDKEVSRNELLHSNLVSTYYINRSEYGLFTQKVNFAQKKFKTTKKGPDTNYYYYQLIQQLGNSYIYQSKTEPFIRNLTEQVVYHSASYIINHYLHLIELLQQGNLNARDLAEKGLNFLNDTNTETFLKTLKENYHELYCQVSFHYNIYKAFLIKDDVSYFHNSLKFFELVSGSANDTYRSVFYQLLINYCIERTNKNEPEYYKELFRLYNKKLNEGLIQDLQVGNFPINNFRDYIFVALQLGEMEWIKWFIRKYSDYLPQNVREDEINLSYGILHYNEGKYEDAIISLNKVAGENYIHYMDGKYYKMRLFYETKRYEEAILEIDNYKHYLRQHKEIPETFAKPYKQFIKDYLSLMNILLKGSKDDAEIFASGLRSKAQTPRKRWILKKAEELAKEH
ncbi:MAG: hypothetical protein IAE90_07940 [Ignavibacteria bacterium]|nr:hypothetical protein [Ignavibacteria bacterium]